MLGINNFANKSVELQPKNIQMNDQDHLRKMFIGGLSGITTEDSMRAFFSQWGEVVDAIVMRDPTTKRSRGFGFITYSDQSMVDKAQSSRPHTIDGKMVDTKRALPRPELGKNEGYSAVKKIFVGGLKENHDAHTLQDHFSQFGNVVSVKILTDKATGRKRGFAFVEFDDYDSVDKAVLHKTHVIKYVTVDVKKSVYKQELAKKIAHNQQVGGIQGLGGMPAAMSAAYPAAAYNAQAYAAYPAQVPTAVGAYNGWASYAQAGNPAAGFQQAPHLAAAPAAYGYASPQNGAAGAAWNGTTAYTTWTPNGYATQAAAPVTAAGVAQAGNGWNPNATAQNFGDYQQAYNGGPQKAGSLQTNRVNPYNVAAAPSYGI